MDPDLVPPFIRDLQQLTSFDECLEVLRSPDFRAFGYMPGAAFLFYGSLVAIDGEEHKERRRWESELVASAALERYERDTLVPSIWRRLRAVQPDAEGQVRVDLVRLIRNLTLEIGGQILGLDGLEDDARTDRLGDLADAFTAGVRVQWMKGDADAILEAAREALRRFVEEFYEPARARRADLPAGERPLDLLTVMGAHQGHLQASPYWDAELPVRECVLYLVASAFTTAMNVCHTVAHLQAWIAAHPEDAARLTDPAFLRAATNEALRLHHSSPANLRVASRDLVLSTGRAVAEGEVVAVLLGDAGRDHLVYGPSADAFDPHRQVPGAVRPYGLAFAAGAHTCLGQALAMGAGEGRRTTGAVVQILLALYQAGLEPDRAHHPEADARTFADFFSRYPVVFTALRREVPA